MSTIKVFETFAGIGAQHKALKILQEQTNLKFEVVGTSEWDIWANISYNSIHHNGTNVAKELTDSEINTFLEKFVHSNDSKTPMTNKALFRKERIVRELLYSSIVNAKNQGSIVNVKGDELLKNIGKFDLLTYSFPCQDLSVAGSFHGFNQGMAKGSGTRSGLLWEIQRILEELDKKNSLPNYLLLENVKNMISDKHKDDYLKWLEFLQSLGYRTQTYLLNSKEYGIPQNRERVYALSIRKGAKDFTDTWLTKKQIVESNKPKDFSVETKTNYKLHDLLRTNYNNIDFLKEAIEAIPNKTPSRKRIFNENRVLFSTNENVIKKNLAKNNSYKVVSYKNNFYLNFCRTITTKQDRHPNAGVIDLKGIELDIPINKAGYRFLTTRETFLLMGFTDKDYDNVKKTELLRKAVLYRQAGNSIVVNVLVAIFNHLENTRRNSNDK